MLPSAYLVYPALYCLDFDCFLPAPILWPFTTLTCPRFCMYCSLFINHYLFEYTVLLLIMLHMDLNPSSSEFSLQKTSPHTDPEALRQLSTEVLKLSRLTLLTEEMMKILQSLSITAQVPPPPVSQSNLITNPVLPRKPIYGSPFIEKYDRTASKCKGLLMQWLMFNTEGAGLDCVMYVCNMSVICGWDDECARPHSFAQSSLLKPSSGFIPFQCLLRFQPPSETPPTHHRRAPSSEY